MNRKKLGKFLKNWSPVILLMLVIFTFSNFAATDSDKQSGLFVNLIKTLFPNLENASFLVNLVRKTAHFLEYAVFGFLTARAFKNSGNSKKPENSPFYAVDFCLAYSITDELHQYFVPGRSMQLSDIFLDTLGATFGIFIYHFTHKK
jgi:VanZ family protein